jgi:hypothetical protein
VRFDQDYRSDHYHDWNRKSMQLVKRGERRKMRGETWLQKAQANGN